MAEGFVVDEKLVYMNTNKGKLYFSIYYLDIPIEVGNVVTVTKSYGGESWYPNVNPRSVIGSNGGFTVFESDGGAIKTSLSGSSLAYAVYDEGENLIMNGVLPLPSTSDCFCIWYPFFIGSNGVAFAMEPPFIQTPITGSDTIYTQNTLDSFGLISRPSFKGIVSAVVNERNLKIASAILRDSSFVSNDPYADGGESGTGGGTGNFDGTSDSIDIPGLPTLSAIGTGFVTLYTPTVAQLHNLANYMWNADVTTLDFWKKIVADPIDLILGLNIVPVESTIAGTKSVNVGFIDTGIAMNYTNSQYVEVDCGSINVNEYWGAYLDYSPYTRAEIYLPYCGYHAIDADEIMGKTVTVKYHVDILSGACTAFVKCGQSVLYQFSGSCASAIPVTSSQYGDQVIAAATLAAQLASLPAMGAGAAASAAGAAGAMEAIGETESSYGHMLEARNIGTAIADAASTVTKMKPNIARSGAIGNMAGQLAIQTPYIILSRPRQCLPAYQNTYKGYPANITSTLGSLSGFTVVDSIHLENIPCTLDEQNEIDKFLKTGVII